MRDQQWASMGALHPEQGWSYQQQRSNQQAGMSSHDFPYFL